MQCIYMQDDRDQQPYRLRFVSDGTLSDEFFFVAQVRPLERTPWVVHMHMHMHMPMHMPMHIYICIHIYICVCMHIAPPRGPLPGAAA